MGKKLLRILWILGIVLMIGVIVYYLNYFNLISHKKYLANDFNIEIIESTIDFNNNGIDDYEDILNGAKKDAENHPRYKSTYYAGGYPPQSEGVCTDLVWRAFKEAGYSLKDMVDNDIEKNKKDYNIQVIDKNIDFRRVVNLRVFFDKYATTLTNDINEIEEWMPGDIVIFGNNTHIGIVSNYRNKDGISYILHNGGQPVRDEDYLKRGNVTKHYRFDASKIPLEVLYRWDN